MVSHRSEIISWYNKEKTKRNLCYQPTGCSTIPVKISQLEWSFFAGPVTRTCSKNSRVFLKASILAPRWCRHACSKYVWECRNLYHLHQIWNTRRVMGAFWLNFPPLSAYWRHTYPTWCISWCQKSILCFCWSFRCTAPKSVNSSLIEDSQTSWNFLLSLPFQSSLLPSASSDSWDFFYSHMCRNNVQNALYRRSLARPRLTRSCNDYCISQRSPNTAICFYSLYW